MAIGDGFCANDDHYLIIIAVIFNKYVSF